MLCPIIKQQIFNTTKVIADELIKQLHKYVYEYKSWLPNECRDIGSNKKSSFAENGIAD